MRNLTTYLAAPLLLLTTVGAFCPKPGPDLLAAYNFQPLVPPSNMVTVGAVLAVEDEMEAGPDGEHREKMKMCCGPRASLGQDFIPVSSATIGSAFRDSTKSTWKMDASMLEKISGRFDTSKVDSIEVTIANARILSLSDADVLENLPARSEECRRAIRARLSQGFNLTMVNAALIADLQYKVEWKQKTNFDKKARLVEMQKLAASMGGGQTRIGLSQMESKGLALGVRTDAFLLALSVPEMNPHTPEIAERASREKREGMHQISADAENPDAPYVLPKGGGYVHPQFDFEE